MAMREIRSARLPGWLSGDAKFPLQDVGFHDPSVPDQSAAAAFPILDETGKVVLIFLQVLERRSDPPPVRSSIENGLEIPRKK